MNSDPFPRDAIVAEALARLAIARSGVLDDTTGEVYMDALADLAPEFIQRACFILAGQPREAFETLLPSVGTIRTLVSKLAKETALAEHRAKLLPLPKSSDDEPTFFCLTCRDESSGWRPIWCQGGGEPKDTLSPAPKGVTTSYCGRKLKHGPHHYVERCSCYETNPVIAKRREAESIRRTEKTAS